MYVSLQKKKKLLFAGLLTRNRQTVAISKYIFTEFFSFNPINKMVPKFQAASESISSRPNSLKFNEEFLMNNRLFAKLLTGVSIYKFKFHNLYLNHKLPPNSFLHFHASPIRRTIWYSLGIFWQNDALCPARRVKRLSLTYRFPLSSIFLL
jgi:hypothetical protein